MVNFTNYPYGEGLFSLAGKRKREEFPEERVDNIFSEPFVFDFPFNDAYLSKLLKDGGCSLEKEKECLFLAEDIFLRFIQKNPAFDTPFCWSGLRYLSLLISLKCLSDHEFNNSLFLRLFPQETISLQKLNRMEVAFLNMMEWVI